GEVIRSNQGLYHQLLSTSGVTPSTMGLFVLSHTDLSSILSASNNIVRVVFRVKTNRRYDDEDYCELPSGHCFSGHVGAAIVDDVQYGFNALPNTVLGLFENASDINNSPGMPATAAWKSTGKPPGATYHTASLSGL